MVSQRKTFATSGISESHFINTHSKICGTLEAEVLYDLAFFIKEKEIETCKMIK